MFHVKHLRPFFFASCRKGIRLGRLHTILVQVTLDILPHTHLRPVHAEMALTEDVGLGNQPRSGGARRRVVHTKPELRDAPPRSGHYALHARR